MRERFAIVKRHIADYSIEDQAALFDLMTIFMEQDTPNNNNGEFEKTAERTSAKGMSSGDIAKILTTVGSVKTGDGFAASGQISGAEMPAVVNALSGAKPSDAKTEDELADALKQKVKEERATLPLKIGGAVVGTVIGGAILFSITGYGFPRVFGPPSTTTSLQAPSATLPVAVVPSASVLNPVVSATVPASTNSSSAARRTKQR